ncbi:MAG: phage Gp19/Gp15/Gp42 family protein [Bifidobacteriaceae bacterium]|jgi:hypothetical protein|nr:phage Gp19/Gp15/Gp42 family protein [Bifidobacteriaceae bacterium]
MSEPAAPPEPEPFATWVDLEKRWRPLSDEERLAADERLADASAMVRAECPRVDARVEAGKLARRVVEQIVCAMVRRCMSVPADQAPVTQQQQTAGPFSLSVTPFNPGQDLFLLRSERRQLAGPPRAFTIRLGGAG